MKEVKCPLCNGKGEYDAEVAGVVYPVNCTFCNGTGKVPKSATYSGKRR